MTAMTVKLTMKFPAWNERDGLFFEVEANTKREAIEKARRDADNGGHLCGLSVRDYSFRVVEGQD